MRLFPVLHFAFGTLPAFFLRRRVSLLDFVLLGLMGMSADFDAFFNGLPWLGHRMFFHTLVFSVLVGVVGWFLLRSFWLGFLAHASHVVLDMFDGRVSVLPGVWIGWDVVKSRETALLMSGVVATVIFVLWIGKIMLEARSQQLS